jgi:undecaprenyl-diphosphatase
VHALITFLTLHPTLAIAVVFAAALLESVAVIGTVIPGSTVVFAAGVLIGLQALDPWWVAGAAVTGAVLGDGVSFGLGRRYHEALLGAWPLKTHPEWMARGQAYFSQHGGKSVFLGRFLGPLRAIVPVVAGMSDMPLLRFALVNLLSAIAWSAAHLLPGALFGASMQVAGAVSSRLLVLLVGALAAAWVIALLLRLGFRTVRPLLRRQRDRTVAWAHARSGVVPRTVLSLLDPDQPESLGLLIAAGMLLGGAWLFLGILEDVVTSDRLVQFDHLVFTALQQLRTRWGDALMIAVTELGSARVAIVVIAAVAGVFVWQRCWRTLAYWLSAMVFAQALVWVLKLSLARARPMLLYTGAEQYSFPSGHATSSIVLYGFLAVLVARHAGPRVQQAVWWLTAGLVGLIGFSRLYLGAHWLSDVLAGFSLGTAWVALLSIAYWQHVGSERLPVRAAAFSALAALSLAGSVVILTQHQADVARYAPRPRPAPQVLVDWWGDGWRQLPARRTDLEADPEEALGLQWAGTAQNLTQVLATAGWRPPPPWTVRTALRWLLPTASADQLPVLAKFHQGAPATVTLVRTRDPTQRWVLRLWPSGHRAEVPGAGLLPLWTGMLIREQLVHPAGRVTLALTQADASTAMQGLQSSLLAQGLHASLRQRDAGDVLLVR